jgi:hypothetical protein
MAHMPQPAHNKRVYYSCRFFKRKRKGTNVMLYQLENPVAEKALKVGSNIR